MTRGLTQYYMASASGPSRIRDTLKKKKKKKIDSKFLNIKMAAEFMMAPKLISLYLSLKCNFLKNVLKLQFIYKEFFFFQKYKMVDLFKMVKFF
jgi:hypothetical protein